MGLIHNDDYASREGNSLQGYRSYNFQKFNDEMVAHDTEMSYKDKIDTQPDMFTFNVSGLQGSFYYQGHNTWLVQCSRPVKVELDIDDDSNFSRPYSRNTLNESFNMVRSVSFNNFTLIDEYGTRYNFGGKNHPEAIEYSVGFFSQNNEEIAATTWHLTSIEYTDGRRIDFKYVRKNFVAQFSIYENFTRQSIQNIPHVYYNGRQLEGQCFKSNINPNFDYAQGSLIAPSYLSEITDGQTHVYFDISESDELRYDIRRYYYNHYNGEQPSGVKDMPYLQEYNADGSPAVNNRGSIDCVDSLKWYKLNKIRVINSENKLIKQFVADYNIDDVEKRGKERLALTSIAETDITTGSKEKVYEFEYDNIGKLPTYCSYNVDHWDFYAKTGIVKEYEDYTARRIKLISEFQSKSNGGIPVSNELEPGNWDYDAKNHDQMIAYAPSATDKSAYYLAREADTTVSQYGALKKIIYPTGGYTRFEYENHTFCAYVDSTRARSIAVNKMETAGGLRVKKVITSADGTPESEITSKEYLYYDAAAKTHPKSSGILLRPRQYRYVKGGFAGLPMSYRPTGFVVVYSSQSLYPVSCNGDGSHIGYTSVTEKYPDGSMSVSHFTNFDNGYPDEPYQSGNAGGLGASFPYSSLAMERGLLLSKTDYDSSGKKERETTYEYSKLGGRQYIPTINVNYHGFLVFYLGGYLRESFDTKLYFHSMYPTGSSVTEYNADGKSMTASTKYEYSDKKQVKEITVKDTDGMTRAKQIFYADSPETYFVPGASEMRRRHCTGVVLKEANYRKISNVDQQMDSTVYRYTSANIANPWQIALYQGNSGKAITTTLRYDSGSNPVYMAKGNGEERTVYVWGYASQYPVAEIKNASVEEVEAIIGNLGVFAARPTPDFSKLTTLQGRLAEASVTIYKFQPGVGITECISPDGQSIKFHYDGLGRLSHTTDGDGHLVTVNEYGLMGRQLKITQ
ncbi:MAG: hypothetical protein J6L73_01000 [Muribaculaceae bacterium]|nr:hypothetical protein [Muribaculaceae bacterium]